MGRAERSRLASASFSAEHGKQYVISSATAARNKQNLSRAMSIQYMYVCIALRECKDNQSVGTCTGTCTSKSLMANQTATSQTIHESLNLILDIFQIMFSPII